MEIHENLSLENIDGEIWKEIEGYNEDYFVSNFGRVKSFNNYNRSKEKILMQNEDSHGYLYVDLYKNRKSKPKRIHTLMYKTHIEKIPEGFVIHHKDFTKNNYLDNFKMMTKEKHTVLHHTGKKYLEESKELMSETRKEKFKNGELNLKGEHNPNSTLKEQDVIQIRLLCDKGILTQKEIAEKFGVNKSTISYIKTGKSWKHLKEN